MILYNPDKQERGRFSVGLKDEPDSAALFASINGSAPGILKLPGKETGTEYFAGIVPVIDQEFISGYISAVVEYDTDNPFVARVPDFLQSGKKTISTVVDPAKLNIFRFRNMKVISVSGDLYPSLDQIKAITAAVNNEAGEAWMTINFNDEQYKAYVQQVNDEITAVALKEIHFSWRLFNFFKIFILHSLIILLLYVILYTLTVRGIKYSFRTQLLIAFLVISIFPVLFLAFYNRQVVNERSTGEVLNELSERAEYLQNHFSFQLRKNPDRNYSEVFKNAADELGISFSVYDNSNLVYSSAAPYYNAGLLPSKLNPEAYYSLNYLNFREYVTTEKLDGYEYNSFYRKIALGDKGYVLCINDAFNKLDASLGTADFDIFLFGVYSFAVLIIIILSTVLADKISSPIRKLTSATGSVAHGDLNIRLANTERGEIRDLIEGFNYMTEELKKNEVEMAMLERENAWKEMAKQVAHEIKNPLDTDEACSAADDNFVQGQE